MSGSTNGRFGSGAEIGTRVDAGKLGSFEKSVEDGSGLSTAPGTRTVVVLAAEDPVTHLLLGVVVVDGNQGVVEKEEEGRPMMEHVSGRLGQTALRESGQIVGPL